MAGGVTGVLVILGAATAWALLISFLSFHQGHLYYRLLHHWGRGEGPQNQDQEPGQVSVKTVVVRSSCGRAACLLIGWDVS